MVTMNITTARLSSGLMSLNRASSTASAFSTGTVLPKHFHKGSVSGLLLARTVVTPIQCSSYDGAPQKRRGLASQAATLVSELDTTNEDESEDVDEATWPKGSSDITQEERIEMDANKSGDELSVRWLCATSERRVSGECSQVDNFGLSATTVAALRKRGIEALFPIQAAVIKPAMEGRDVIGRARTGTGKTMAFALPVIEKLME
eukprot:9499839-Pyramimonas_sp.AAC.1